MSLARMNTPPVEKIGYTSATCLTAVNMVPI